MATKSRMHKTAKGEKKTKNKMPLTMLRGTREKKSKETGEERRRKAARERENERKKKRKK